MIIFVKKNNMTTKEAFKQLISMRGWWQGILKDAEAGYKYKKRFEAGSLSTDSIEKILSTAGYQIIQEKMWTKKETP